jgi:hypothetical protein
MRSYPYSFDNGAGEVLTFTRRVTRNGVERVEGENVTSPGAGPPMHVHLWQDEVFTVLEGGSGTSAAAISRHSPVPARRSFSPRVSRIVSGTTEMCRCVARRMSSRREMSKYRKYADAPEPMTQFDPRHHARIAR